MASIEKFLRTTPDTATSQFLIALLIGAVIPSLNFKQGPMLVICGSVIWACGVQWAVRKVDPRGTLQIGIVATMWAVICAIYILWVAPKPTPQLRIACTASKMLPEGRCAALKEEAERIHSFLVSQGFPKMPRKIVIGVTERSASAKGQVSITRMSSTDVPFGDRIDLDEMQVLRARLIGQLRTQ